MSDFFYQNVIALCIISNYPDRSGDQLTSGLARTPESA